MLRRSRSMGVLYQDYGVVRLFMIILKIPAMIRYRDFYITWHDMVMLIKLLIGTVIGKTRYSGIGCIGCVQIHTMYCNIIN